MANTQKIVHLIGSLGQFEASHNLFELARAQAATGELVSVIAFSATKRSRQLFTEVGVRSEIVQKRWSYDPFTARQLFQSLKEIKPTIVHLWGRRATDVAAIVRRAVPQAKLVATLAKLPQLGNPWWPNKSLNTLDGFVVEREAVRGEFIDAGQGEAKVCVIPPGVTRDTDEPLSRREVLHQLGLPTDARVISIAGPLVRWQLIDEAIWAFELIRILHDLTHLVIVGEGPERARLERFTRQVTEPAVVRFVPNSALLKDALRHSEIYWQAGKSESIPPELLTAMSLEVPVVASDVPAHREVIESDVNGFLVPTAKRAIWARRTDQLLRSSELRTKFAQAAKQTVVERYSLLAMTQAYERLYRDLVAQKSPLCPQL